MTDFKISPEKIAESISLLTQLYNTPDEKLYAKARDLVLTAALAKSVEPIRADRVQVNHAPFYQTGVDWLDFWFGGGVRRKEVIIVGAVPFGGKTHTLAWLASQFIPKGAKVAHFFGEDLIEDVQDYYARAVGKKNLSNVWLVDMQDYMFTVREIEGAYDKLKKDKSEPDIVVVDHMDIMQALSRAKADWEEATDVIRDLKVFAKRQNTILFTASQAHEKTKERKGIGRFYRAKIGKSANADIILLVDNVIDNAYYFNRIKARGRDVRDNPGERVLEVDWNTMTVENVT